MYISDTLTMSDTLVRLMEERRKDSVCVKLIHRALVDLMNGKRTTLLASKLPGNYFSFREKEGMISYMPSGKKQEIGVDGRWKRKNRQSMKPSRWIKLMLNPRLARKLKDHLYAEFNTIVQHEELKGAIEFSEVSIRDGYNSTKFVTGIDSCMWDDPVMSFYDAFECTVLVAAKSDGGKFWGRAIVWHDVEVEGQKERVTIVDRIYCKGEDVLMAFREYASEMGWWHKVRQNSDLMNYGFMLPDGDDRRPINTTVRATAKRDLGNMPYFPYLDTFRYGTERWVSNKIENSKWIYGDAHGGRALSHALDIHDARGRWIERATAIQVDGLYYRPGDPSLMTCAISGELVDENRAVLLDFGRHNERVRFYVDDQLVTLPARLRSELSGEGR